MNFHVAGHKASLRTRLKVVRNVLMNRPVAFRLAIVDGKVYLPETLYPENFYMTGCILQRIDSEGEFVPYSEQFKLPDAHRHSCDCACSCRYKLQA